MIMYMFPLVNTYFLLCLIILDELVNKMSIGNEYKIIGIPTCVKSLQTSVCIEANSITFCNPKGKENVVLYINKYLNLNSFV